MEKKVCSKCRQEKSVSEFRKNKATKDGFESICRHCVDNRYSLKCENCGIIFGSPKRNKKFCSLKCSNKSRANSVKFICDNCGNEGKTTKSKFDRSEKHFCSQECSSKFRFSKVVFKCEICEKERAVGFAEYQRSNHHFCSRKCFEKWYSVNLVGDNCPSFGRKISEKHKMIISKANKGKVISENTRLKLKNSKIGVKNPNYNHFLSEEERIKGRNIEGYNDWISSVYKRDKYTCICCGDNKGGNLNAHHLNGYNWDKENRLNIDNGVCLCCNCHKKLHKIYGYGNNTLEQFKEFYKNKTNKEFEVARV
ncbi:NUMOD3 domain-containing DNA-binding protein (plasmid) [Clostridium perfringens]